MPDPISTPGLTAPEAPAGGITDAAIQQAVADANARHAALQAGQEPTVAAATTADSSKPQRPEHIPEKFWDADKGEVNVEAMAKSYSELERTKGKPPEEAPKPEDQQQQQQAEVSPEEKALSEALGKAGIDFTAVRDEYSAGNGEIKPETRSKLERAFGKDVVDNYFAGLKAQEAAASANYASTVQAAAGSPEAYGQMTQWAADNLSPQEIARFNEAVNSLDATKATLAVENLKAKFEATGGKAPSLVNPSATSAVDAQGYPSLAHMTRDMNDPKYRTDAAYRREVEAKVALSTHLMR